MKTIHALRILASFVLLAFILAFMAAPLQAQSGSYSNLTVTGSGGATSGTLTISGTGSVVDFQNQSTMFGTWTSGSDAPGLTLNFADIGSGTTQVNFIGSGSSTTWEWWQYPGGGAADLPLLMLDPANQLVIFNPATSGTGIMLDPTSTGTSTFAGSVVISGDYNELPHQQLLDNNSILTRGLGDSRYVSGSYCVSQTGTDHNGNPVASFGLIGGNASGPGSLAIDDSTASGEYSIALGDYSTATGYQSLAHGIDAAATGDYSTAIGLNAQATSLMSYANAPFALASGSGAVASGESSTASGFQAIASGVVSNASGDEAQAIGNSSTANGDYSMAIGYGSTASGMFSTVTGFEAHATGDYSTASGLQSTASGYCSIASGVFSQATTSGATASGFSSLASGQYSTAAGASTTAAGYAQYVVGQYNAPQGSGTNWVGTDNLFIVGNGTSASGTSNAFVVSQNGDTNVMGALVVSGTSGSTNKVTGGGLVVTGSASPTGSGTTYVTSGTSMLLVPQQGDVSMGMFTAGAPPQ